ncbi:hypothetical protein CYLTODRAFT_453852 [Cylindrobasidium torrendii FP15055 ss-10]|uniref:RRM domain-containing protein n=1 Tax=Cylindrobasidium torrendii FP15055 ss-10 TaxID=1314674 RepID=A0A0D7BCT4_9AGAR|nr:hypothetical protein CYLTODRAFT_453852 [Cylindrobasidium torrendii FP15055 ss-10]
MPTLLERIEGASVGPVRSKGARGGNRSIPYAKEDRNSRGNVEDKWSHDKFEQFNSLGARLGVDTPSPPPPRLHVTNAVRAAIVGATGASLDTINIRGASGSHNVVEISGLLPGTTPADVKTIFQRCGEIVSAKSEPSPDVRIRLTFKEPKSAQEAIKTFHNQQADGKTLSVKLVGVGATPNLAGRIQSKDGLAVVAQEGNVDMLLGSNDRGSKMRSDALMDDPRSHVLIAPPGANPRDYSQQRGRGSRGPPRRGRGGPRGRGAKGRGMDID